MKKWLKEPWLWVITGIIVLVIGFVLSLTADRTDSPGLEAGGIVLMVGGGATVFAGGWRLLSPKKQ